MLRQNERGIGKFIPDAQDISRDPKDFLRAKPEGHLEGGGTSQEFRWSLAILFIINHLIYLGKIGSVKSRVPTACKWVGETVKSNPSLSKW